jgi:hypothetical protein
MPDYADEPKIDFAVFKNKYAKTDRHPSEVGKIEFTREFLKVMVERAKEGTMPVLRVAMWERTSKAGMPYKNFRLELERKRVPEPEPPEGEEESDDGLPW